MSILFKAVLNKKQVELNNKWIGALRSGDFEQGFGQMEEDGKYCCLGVAQKVLNLTDDGDNASLSCTSAVALGLKDGEGTLDSDYLGCSSLITLNDDERMSFEEIADFIEAELGMCVIE